jgi:hypothetical protein
LVARDSTGLGPSHASRCFEWRSKRGRRQRAWLKWSLPMRVELQMLVAQRARPGRAATSSPSPARRGNDSEANHRSCRETLGVESLIPAKKRRSVRVIATTPYRQEMVRLLGDAGDEEARRTYRLRIAEGVLLRALSAKAHATRTR